MKKSSIFLVMSLALAACKGTNDQTDSSKAKALPSSYGGDREVKFGTVYSTTFLYYKINGKIYREKCLAPSAEISDPAIATCHAHLVKMAKSDDKNYMSGVSNIDAGRFEIGLKKDLAEWVTARNKELIDDQKKLSAYQRFVQGQEDKDEIKEQIAFLKELIKHSEAKVAIAKSAQPGGEAYSDAMQLLNDPETALRRPSNGESTDFRHATKLIEYAVYTTFDSIVNED